MQKQSCWFILQYVAFLHDACYHLQLTAHANAVGRGARGAVEEEDGAVFMTDQDDDDDEHVKLLNPVKVGILFGAAAGSKGAAKTAEFIKFILDELSPVHCS